MTIVNLNNYKKEKNEKKLNDKIMGDIEKIIHILELTQKSLNFFNKYKPVQELISVIETHKVLLTLRKKKHENHSNINQDQKQD